MYSINFTENNKKLCLSLHYSAVSCYLFVNGKLMYKFKPKDSETVVTTLCFKRLASRKYENKLD